MHAYVYTLDLRCTHIHTHPSRFSIAPTLPTTDFASAVTQPLSGEPCQRRPLLYLNLDRLQDSDAAVVKSVSVIFVQDTTGLHVVRRLDPPQSLDVCCSVAGSPMHVVHERCPRVHTEATNAPSRWQGSEVMPHRLLLEGLLSLLACDVHNANECSCVERRIG